MLVREICYEPQGPFSLLFSHLRCNVCLSHLWWSAIHCFLSDDDALAMEASSMAGEDSEFVGGTVLKEVQKALDLKHENWPSRENEILSDFVLGPHHKARKKPLSWA